MSILYVSLSIYNTLFLQDSPCSNITNANANNHLNATACYQPKEIYVIDIGNSEWTASDNLRSPNLQVVKVKELPN